MAASPREQIAEGLAGALSPEQIKTLVDEILAIKKQAWVSCKDCGKRNLTEIADAKAVAGALKDLLAEGFGRPAAAELDDRDRIVFERVVYMAADE